MKHLQHFLLSILTSLALVPSVTAQCSFTLSATSTPVQCFGQSNGAIDLTVSAGTGPFNFAWSTGFMLEDPGGLAATTYTVTVTDALACTATLSHTITSPPVFSVNAIDETLTCYILTANIPVNITNGVPPYSWNVTGFGPPLNGTTSATTFFVDGINQAGSYAITVTDATGCTAVDIFLVDQNIVPPLANAGPDRVLTCTDPQTQLDGSGSSSAPQIIYQWTSINGNIVSGNNILTPTVNASGVYTLEVTDTQNGCTASDQAIVTDDYVSPTFTMTDQVGIPCGSSEVILPAPNVPGATFNWTGPAGFASTVPNPIVDVPGAYTLVVSAANGCTTSAAITVFPGPTLPAQDIMVTDLPCMAGMLGAIDLTPSLGTAPFTYLWSNGATTEDINNLTAGDYTLQMADAAGCTYYALVHVLQATTGLILTVATTSPTCFGAHDGSINLGIGNGTAPFSVFWSGPNAYQSTVEDPTGLSPGNYQVTVSDVTGCTNTAFGWVSQPAAISTPSNGITIQNPTCYGGATGAINITPQGGKPPYTFDWSNDGPETPDNDPQNITGLTVGTYNVTITDANGCTLVPSAFSLSQPAPIQINASIIDIPCGSSNPTGAIDLTVTGTGGPFTYLWSNGASTVDISGLQGGTYTVTVTKANGCTQTFAMEVLHGGSLIPSTDFTITPVSCQSGASDGAITLNTLPPTAQGPFSFSWTGQGNFTASTQNISGLLPGNYDFTLTDANGCQFVAFVTVPKLSGTFGLSIYQGQPTCSGDSLLLNINGGVAPYTYHWSNNSTQPFLVYSSTGTYTVTVTDAVGCTKIASTSIATEPLLTLTIAAVANACNGGTSGAVNLTVAGGVGPYNYVWNNGASTQNINGLTAGTYCATVTDAIGCTRVRCATVTEPLAMDILTNEHPLSCFGAADGSLSVALFTAGTPPFSWAISGLAPQNGTSSTQSFLISDLAAGPYCLTVTNANGCSMVHCDVLYQPAQVSVDVEELSNTCNAALLRANGEGGIPPLTYTWTGPNNFLAFTPIVTVPVSGNYTVIVRDVNDCFATVSTTVDLAGAGACGYIRGAVVLDSDENCVADPGETGLNGWLVRAEGADTLYGVTNSQGKFLIGAPVGTYTLAVLQPNALWEVCPGMPQATITMSNDTAVGGDFPVKMIVDCPALSVNIVASQLRRCFLNNYYYVTFCNEGTVPADNAFVDVTLDPYLVYQASSINAVDLGNNQYRFFVGNLDIGDCGTFNIRVQVSCDATLGQTHCTEAHIYPDSLCVSDALWSGANLALRSVCDNDSLRFILKNTGTGKLTHLVDYVVVEDAVMLMRAPIPLLNAGDSIALALPANGSTWRVEVDQETYHPYPQPVGLSVEGCTTGSTFSTGFVNQFSQNDAPPPVDIDCTTNIGSFDPNDKQGFPIGYGTAHYIRPGTEIEYLIRFQNTGTDTAFTVHIVDTLSAWLDPATVRFGASSHPYRFDLSGEGVVHFIFDNISLPDSNVNEAASHGFAAFSIKPRTDALLESVIENTAAIYFDYNDPVYTNTTFHRLGENFISVGTWQPHLPLISVQVTPNPFSDATILEVKGLLHPGVLKLQVYDFQGMTMRTLDSAEQVFHLRKADWPAGTYFFRITQNGQMVGTGRLVVQ